MTSEPEEMILAPGGEIFFLVENDRAIGTCALIRMGERSYELAKMAVREDQRGRGLGKSLMRAAIDWVVTQGGGELVILSNTVLAPAISLYRSFGFETTHLGTHPDYERCNIVMKLKLSLL
jgi:putative acetyltransferase